MISNFRGDLQQDYLTVAIFSDRGNAENAVRDLFKAGFGEQEIGFESRPLAPRKEESTEPLQPPAGGPAGDALRGAGFMAAVRSFFGEDEPRERQTATAGLVERLDEERRRYIESAIQNGGLAVLVLAGPRQEEVEELLQKNRGQLVK